MMLYNTVLASALSLQLATAFAHGGEDHGAAPALPVNTQRLPSAEAHSPDFELYAQLQGNTLTVYLDRYRDNQPIVGANIEVESETFNATLKPVAQGAYQVVAEALNHPGEHSLLFTVLAGEQSDLLDTVLSVSPGAAVDQPTATRPWWWLAGGSGLLLVAAAFGLTRRRRLGSITSGSSV